MKSFLHNLSKHWNSDYKLTQNQIQSIEESCLQFLETIENKKPTKKEILSLLKIVNEEIKIAESFVIDLSNDSEDEEFKHDLSIWETRLKYKNKIKEFLTKKLGTEKDMLKNTLEIKNVVKAQINKRSTT